jgi:hypothetical protein
MPRTVSQAEIMQSTGNFHHHITDHVLPVADFVFDDAAALHAAHRVLNPHFLARNALILCFLRIRQFTATRFLRWLLDDDVRYGKALKSHVLIQDTSRRQLVRFIVDNRFLVPLSGICRTQVANTTLLVNQENILDGMAFLLSAVIFRLLISSYWSLNWTFRSVVIKKGDCR